MSLVFIHESVNGVYFYADSKFIFQPPVGVAHVMSFTQCWRAVWEERKHLAESGFLEMALAFAQARNLYREGMENERNGCGQNQEDDQAQGHGKSAAQRACPTPARQAPVAKRGSRLGAMLEATC
ncbi:hypothetical protein EBT25_02815 [bacterium]|nr:hypothetical protein [bacterium]